MTVEEAYEKIISLNSISNIQKENAKLIAQIISILSENNLTTSHALYILGLIKELIPMLTKLD